MNLNQLRFAKAVAETASFSRAAETCFVTQPTLSNAIAQLEQELGGRIFRRTTRHVALTGFGRHVLPLVEAVLEAQSELVAGARAFHEPAHRLIRIGLSPLVDMHLLTWLLAPYREANPDVELFFKQCFLDDMDQRLDQGTVDVAIVPRGLPRVGRESCRLYAEPLMLLPMAPDSDEGTTLTTPFLLSKYAGEPVILTSGCGLADAIADLFRQAGLSLRAYPGQALNYQVVEDWAGLGIGTGILPRSKVSPGYRTARPLQLDEDQAATVEFLATWPTDARDSGHVAAFIDHLDRIPGTVYALDSSSCVGGLIDSG